MEETKEFFRFYDAEKDGFDETRPMYEKIIEAFAKSGQLPEEFIVLDENGQIDRKETLDKVVEECKRIDQAEIERTGGLVKEDNIGLAGFFNSHGIDVSSKEAAEERKKMGQDALDKMPKEDEVPESEKKSYYEAKAFLGSLAAGPYFPRSTCASAAHFMGEGHIMQIGCSQGKTSVVAMTTYEQFKAGKKVFSTSSSPGLVPENYDEARKFYEKMGVAEDFCAISQNANDNVDHIVLFHNGKKYEVRSDGEIRVEIDKEMQPSKLSKEEMEELQLIVSEDGSYNFEESVRNMMASKGIIMGDTITLGKYQHLMPKRNGNGVIEGSFLIVDEADAELLDTYPQEILGKKYEGNELAYRRENREAARDTVAAFKGDPSDLEKLAEEKGLPLDFLLDAYEAKMNFSEPEKYDVRDGKIFVLNPNTNVMMPASQGLTQAILANDKSLEYIPEREVLGETDIPKLFSNFETASLMSGTMQDKGITQEEMTEDYKNKRMNFLKQCGPGVALSASDGVRDWRLVTPKTRDEKGSVIVTKEGILRDLLKPKDERGKDIETSPEEIIEDWKEYLEKNGKELEDRWRKEVQEEAEIRSNLGRPVMVSVYGDRNPMEGATDPVSGKPVETYTDKHQIAKDGDIHKIGDDKCLFVKNGKGEIATFDDFYGRGYTFKFGKMDEKGNPVTDEKGKIEKKDDGGHVLITSLPQNSRNLEQFLFRVARGGDKGSSSIIISPNDPVLVAFLEKLEAEKGKDAANKYFKGVMDDSIKVDDIVKDIYPKETEKIFMEKAQLIGTMREYEQYLDIKMSKITDMDEAARYSKEFKKQMVTEMKYYRQCGVLSKEERDERISKLLESVQKSLDVKENEVEEKNETENEEKVKSEGQLENEPEIETEGETEVENQAEVGRNLLVQTSRAQKEDEEYRTEVVQNTNKSIIEARKAKNQTQENNKGR